MAMEEKINESNRNRTSDRRNCYNSTKLDETSKYRGFADLVLFILLLFRVTVKIEPTIMANKREEGGGKFDRMRHSYLVFFDCNTV